ncbi:MAG: hypothetical protein CMM74_14530 [Rhodospirillaceae bacterium]|nr:hypothetical protein [Rhodospirillaceae bacterium]
MKGKFWKIASQSIATVKQPWFSSRGGGGDFHPTRARLLFDAYDFWIVFAILAALALIADSISRVLIPVANSHVWT